MSWCWFHEERENTGHSRTSSTTSVIVGRWEGSWCQQRTAMSQTGSAKPSFCASCGQVGRPPSILLVLTSSNKSPPIKTLSTIQMSDESSVLLPSTLDDKPLLQPFRKQTRLIYVQLSPLPQESLARSMLQCIYWPAFRSSFHVRSEWTRSSSNEHDRSHRWEHLTSEWLSIRLKTTWRECLPLSSFRGWCGLREDSQGLRLYPTAWEDHVTGQARLRGKTHQTDPLHTWVFLEELYQSSVRHPLRDNLERVRCDADERDDVRVP